MKKHGDGTWGSGTCPGCGTHNYIGRSCTQKGRCSCGATVSAYGHSYGTIIRQESGHPHRKYKSCTKCGVKDYIDNGTKLKHGDGSNGTCKLCGTHSYSNIGLPQAIHPHESTYKCACGSSYKTYSLSYTCSSCKENSKTASNISKTTGVLSYLDGDKGFGTVILVPIHFYVEYTNMYNNPRSNSIINYEYPPFASFASSIKIHAEVDSPCAPAMWMQAKNSVNYYNTSNNLLMTQTMHINEFGNAFSSGGFILTLSEIPSYTMVTAICGIEGSTQYIMGNTKTYFS